jgi:hypothetical protein
MKVRTKVKAGGISNHNQSALVVKTGVKGGQLNHSQTQTAPVVRTGVKAGGWPNHTQSMR